MRVTITNEAHTIVVEADDRTSELADITARAADLWERTSPVVQRDTDISPTQAERTYDDLDTTTRTGFTPNTTAPGGNR